MPKLSLAMKLAAMIAALSVYALTLGFAHDRGWVGTNAGVAGLIVGGTWAFFIVGYWASKI